MKLLRYLWPLMKRHRWKIVFANLMAVFAAVLTLPVPYLIGSVLINEVVLGKDMHAGGRFSFTDFWGRLTGAAPSRLDVFWAIVWIFLITVTLSYILRYFRTFLGIIIVNDITFHSRKALISHSLILPVGYFEQRDVGDISARLVSDLEKIEQFLKQVSLVLLQDVFVLIGVVVVIGIMDRQALLLLLIGTPAMLALQWLMSGKIKKLSAVEREKMGRFSGLLADVYNNIRLVRSFNRGNVFASRLASRGAEVKHAAIRRQAAFFLTMLAGWFLVTVSLDSFQLFLGYKAVTDASFYAGDIFTIYYYLWVIVGPLQNLIQMVSLTRQAGGAMERSLELITEEPEPGLTTERHANTDFRSGGDAAPVLDIAGEVAFENVGFTYAHGEQVLKNITLNAEPGRMVAVVGPSGAGKTTLISLLLGFYRPTEGRVLIDGTDLSELDPGAYRERIGIVPQETMLFNDTLRENLTVGLTNVPDEKIVEALDMAHAREFIERFEDGLDTIVGVNGIKLSGGQRQRVAIARAWLRDPRILILDEATSSLDSITEQRIQAALNRLIEGRTTIVIAHRLSTIAKADRIFVFEEGEIVESGTHEELVNNNGHYAELYRAQIDGFLMWSGTKNGKDYPCPEPPDTPKTER